MYLLTKLLDHSPKENIMTNLINVITENMDTIKTIIGLVIFIGGPIVAMIYGATRKETTYEAPYDAAESERVAAWKRSSCPGYYPGK